MEAVDIVDEVVDVDVEVDVVVVSVDVDVVVTVEVVVDVVVEVLVLVDVDVVVVVLVLVDVDVVVDDVVDTVDSVDVVEAVDEDEEVVETVDAVEDDVLVLLDVEVVVLCVEVHTVVTDIVVVDVDVEVDVEEVVDNVDVVDAVDEEQEVVDCVEAVDDVDEHECDHREDDRHRHVVPEETEHRVVVVEGLTEVAAEHLGDPPAVLDVDRLVQSILRLHVLDRGIAQSAPLCLQTGELGREVVPGRGLNQHEGDDRDDEDRDERVHGAPQQIASHAFPSPPRGEDARAPAHAERKPSRDVETDPTRTAPAKAPE